MFGNSRSGHLSLTVTFLQRVYANRWARYAVSGVLLALVLWRAHPERIGAAVSSTHVEYLVFALLLTVPFLYLKALRWHLMLRAAGVEATFGEAALSLVGGMGLALVTPARMGELVRAAYLRDAQKWKIGGLVMLDKGFDVLVLAGLSAAGAWVLIAPWAGAALGVVTAIGLAAVYRPADVSRLLHRASSRLPLRTQLENAWSSLESLSPATTTVFLVLTLASFAVVLLQFGIVLLSWRGWSPDIVFMTFPLVILTNVLPITVGGLGIREGAAALLLSQYGVPPARAALAAFLMFLINTALPGVFGALLLPAAGAAPRAPAGSLDRP
jgi:uncharacterized membrane protein YbhN (UPF0104 family)